MNSGSSWIDHGSMHNFPKSPAESQRDFSIYLCQESFGADKTHLLFHEKFRMLAANPLLGEKRTDLEENLRMFTTGNYVIFYRIEKNGIEIVQIVHSSRDLPALWFMQ